MNNTFIILVHKLFLVGTQLKEDNAPGNNRLRVQSKLAALFDVDEKDVQGYVGGQVFPTRLIDTSKMEDTCIFILETNLQSWKPILNLESGAGVSYPIQFSKLKNQFQHV